MTALSARASGCAVLHPRPRPDRRRLRPERAGAAAAWRREGASAGRHASIAAPPPSSRWPAPRPAGLDVVVLDHHTAEPRLPPARRRWSIRTGSTSGSGLASSRAAGVAFLLAGRAQPRAARRPASSPARPEPDLLALLDLVALGTVCDVVPLTGLNRALVGQGLKVMARRAQPGHRRAGRRGRRDASGSTPITSASSSGRAINAGGRDRRAPTSAPRLLRDRGPGRGARTRRAARRATTRAPARSRPRCWTRRSRRPRRRRRRARRAAGARARAGIPGVVGIVAGRLKERYQPPGLRRRARRRRSARARAARCPASISARR